VLTNIGRAVGQEVAGGIEVASTNEELANAAAITLYDASRFMSDLRHSGTDLQTQILFPPMKCPRRGKLASYFS
jgi:hypothetical protein